MIFRTIKAGIDAYEAIRTERLDLESQAAELKKREYEIRAWLISSLLLQKVNTASGTHWTVHRDTLDKPVLDSPKDFFGFCVKKGMLALPYKRINVVEATRLRSEGIDVPGITWGVVDVLHYRNKP